MYGMVAICSHDFLYYYSSQKLMCNINSDSQSCERLSRATGCPVGLIFVASVQLGWTSLSINSCYILRAVLGNWVIFVILT